MTVVYQRARWLDRLIHAAVYGVVLLMPFSVLYKLSEPLRPGQVELYVTPGLELADIPVAVLLLLVVLERWLQRRRGASFARKRLVFARLVLLLGVLGVVSAFGAQLPVLAVYTALRWLLAGVVLWAMVQARVAPRRIAYVLALGLCVHVVIALLQVWNGAPLGLPGELALRPGRRSASIVRLGDEMWLRGYGLTFHPNALGGYLAVALTLLLPLLSSRSARVLWGVLSIGLVATLSRSAVLALLLVVPLLAWSLRRADPRRPSISRRSLVVFGCLAALAIAAFWKPIVVRLDPLIVQLGIGQGEAVGSEQGSLEGRREMNAAAIAMIAKHPFLGVGAGNFPIAMPAIANLRPQYVHNIPLLLGAEVGVAGLLIWLAIAVWAGVVLTRGAANVWLSAAAAASWVIVIIGLFDCYPWSLNAGRLLTVTVLALMESAAQSSHPLHNQPANEWKTENRKPEM